MVMELLVPFHLSPLGKEQNDHSLSWSIQKQIILVPFFLAGFGAIGGSG